MKSKDVKKLFSEFKKIPADREFLDRLRAKLEIQTALDTRETAGVPSFGFKRVASTAVLASLLLGSAGTVFASQASLPGETLYPIKRIVENVRLAAAADQKTKADIRLNIAKERLTEINSLLIKERGENSSSSPELEDRVKEAASNFDSQLKAITDDAEDLEAAGELETALRINTNLYSSGENYKALIEKNKENSSEPIKNRLEDSSRETDKATEKAKEQIERINEKSDKENGQRDGGNAESSAAQTQGQAAISNSYNIRDEGSARVSEPQAEPPRSSGEKVELNPENQKQSSSDAGQELKRLLEEQKQD